MFRILFVCTGNTCRSPMCEILMRKMIRERHWTGVAVDSAGLQTQTGDTISENARLTLHVMGVKRVVFQPKNLTWDLVQWADCILTMTHTQAEICQANGVAAMTFSEYVGLEGDIPDPYGQDLTYYRHTAQKISEYLERLYLKLTQSKDGKIENGKISNE